MLSLKLFDGLIKVTTCSPALLESWRVCRVQTVMVMGKKLKADKKQDRAKAERRTP